MSDASKLYRVRIAAEQFGVNHSTLNSAIRRGLIPAERTACGLPLVTAAAVRRFIRRRPQRGRPASTPSKD